jgi:hypothetical protein
MVISHLQRLFAARWRGANLALISLNKHAQGWLESRREQRGFFWRQPTLIHILVGDTSSGTRINLAGGMMESAPAPNRRLLR